jgi:hypothetical protein
MTNYLEIEKRRWTDNCIGGNSRYAVVCEHAGPLSKILLYETRQEAARQILDPRYARIVDLAEPTVDLEKMPDRYDHEERRRERQQLRAQVTDFGDR